MTNEPEDLSRLHEDPVDLSALDPLRDPGRWQHLIQETLHRVDQAMTQGEQRDDPLCHIARWRRPLVAAAIAASLLLSVVELVLERREGRAERIQRLVTVSAHWPAPGQPPTGEDFVRALSDPALGGATP